MTVKGLTCPECGELFLVELDWYGALAVERGTMPPILCSSCEVPANVAEPLPRSLQRLAGAWGKEESDV